MVQIIFTNLLLLERWFTCGEMFVSLYTSLDLLEEAMPTLKSQTWQATTDGCHMNALTTEM